MSTNLSISERFFSFVEKTTTCWLWKGALCWDGYAQFRLYGKFPKAHRVSYELLVGNIPEGMTLDHLCRVRHCVNPSHLEVVTLRENLLRGNAVSAINARKRECIRGHSLSGENLVTVVGKRQCRKCNLLRGRRWQKANPEKARANALAFYYRQKKENQNAGLPNRTA